MLYPFIPDPTSSTRGDSIRVDVWVHRLENIAEQGCGQYFEIFDYKFTCLLKKTFDLLQYDKDKQNFMNYLSSQHNIQNLDEALENAKKSYDDLMSELYEPHDEY